MFRIYTKWMKVVYVAVIISLSITLLWLIRQYLFEHGDVGLRDVKIQQRYEEKHFSEIYRNMTGVNKFQKVHNTTRVLCWVMTSSEHLDTRAKHVKTTWTKRCNKVLFISDENNDTFPTICLNTRYRGRFYLGQITKDTFGYIYENHFEDADWFLKADDDTYVIIENLRHFLSNESPEKPIYFGDNLKGYKGTQGFPSSGAGYVLSKEALRRFVNRRRDQCVEGAGFPEDVMIGQCMEQLHVTLGDSTDELGRSRFHTFTPSTHIQRRYPAWYIERSLYDRKQEQLSDYPITFHYVTPEMMHELEYYVYSLAVFGIKKDSQNPN